MYKDFEEAATHPSDLEDEVLLPRSLLPQNFSLCLSVCAPYYSIWRHKRAPCENENCHRGSEGRRRGERI